MRRYFETTFTHNYIIGAENNGMVTAYMITLDYDGLALLFSDKPCKSNRQTVIKYRSTKAKREYLASHATAVYAMGTTDEMKSKCRTRVNRHGKEYIENMGECFEYLICTMLNGKQNDKANLCHKDGGDIVVNGVHYQVKFERAGIAI